MRSPITQKGNFQSVPSVFKCFAEHWSRREGEEVWEEEVEKEVKSSSLPSTFDDDVVASRLFRDIFKYPLPWDFEFCQISFYSPPKGEGIGSNTRGTVCLASLPWG